MQQLQLGTDGIYSVNDSGGKEVQQIYVFMQFAEVINISSMRIEPGRNIRLLVRGRRGQIASVSPLQIALQDEPP